MDKKETVFLPDVDGDVPLLFRFLKDSLDTIVYSIREQREDIGIAEEGELLSVRHAGQSDSFLGTVQGTDGENGIQSLGGSLQGGVEDMGILLEFRKGLLYLFGVCLFLDGTDLMPKIVDLHAEKFVVLLVTEVSFVLCFQDSLQFPVLGMEVGGVEDIELQKHGKTAADDGIDPQGDAVIPGAESRIHAKDIDDAKDYAKNCQEKNVAHYIGIPGFDKTGKSKIEETVSDKVGN